MKIYSLNEQTLIVALGDDISDAQSQKVVAFDAQLKQEAIRGVLETWISYGSVAVRFDPMIITSRELTDCLASLRAPDPIEGQSMPNKIAIPVRYHEANEPDMHALCEALNLSASEIATLHASANYRVAMLGFLPGFPYLIGLPPTLHHPRKTKPSLSISKGAVAIGGHQTGIYPHAGPGGWHVIGRTDQKLFEPPNRFLLSPGDEVTFIPT